MPLQRHSGGCYQGDEEVLTAAIISCLTLSKQSLHHICATMALITFDKRGYVQFLVPVLLTYSFYLWMLLEQVLRISSAVLILESSKWQRWAWESFRAHYHSLLNLLARSRMTGQTPAQPSRQIEAMIRGLTDAAHSLGSHPLYSHCWDSGSATATVT